MLAALPDLVLEALRAAMEMIRTVVYRKRIYLPGTFPEQGPSPK